MRHPYSDLPDHAFWRRSIARPAPGEVDPVVQPKFLISRTDKVATAGSCFAQHIAKRLAASGFSYLVTEDAHPMATPDQRTAFNYGTYTARYGNIYTTRQLLQLLKRAYGEWRPADDHWIQANGSVIDPYRPEIQPGGFCSVAELHLDRQQHFRAVRDAVEQADVFVFTLGLTEVWINRADGAAYPVVPGAAAGTFDPETHSFVNLTVSEVVSDLQEAIAFMRTRNPDLRFILTVSPVPLLATALDRSVLVSTCYSKSVLRVAAEMVSEADGGIAYFPSYEVITGNYGNDYYAEDRRQVTDIGVSHVMRLFLKHYADGSDVEQSVAQPAPERRNLASEAAAVVCEEEALDR